MFTFTRSHFEDMLFSRKRGAEEEEKERKVKILRGGNPSARPLLTRIYGTLGCLAITCFFIGLMVFLEKTLPDGSKSQFHPTWKRDLSAKPRRQAAVPVLANVTKGSSTAVPGITTAVILTVDTIRFNPSIAASPCSRTQVNCSTVDVAGRLLRARYQEVRCSTQTLPCSATLNRLPVTSQIPHTTAPPFVTPSSSVNSCVTSVVDCSDSVCFTEYQTPSACGASSSAPIITNPPVSSLPPTSVGRSTSINPCVTSFVDCSDSVCFTQYQTLSPCGGTSSSIPLVITSPPASQSPSPSSTVDPCVVSSLSCISEECFTVFSTQESCLPTSSSPPQTPIPTSSIDPCVTGIRSCIETDCFTVFSTQASCLPTTSLPPSITPTASSDPCLTTSINCFSDRCFTFTSTASSCLPPSSITPSITPTSSADPCITSSLACISEECFFVTSTQASCLATSSLPPSITPSSSVDPCLTSTVSCIETDCFTITSTHASCLPGSTLPSSPPISSPTPISSIDPCLTTTLSCIETDCFTITSTAASCLPISSPPVISPTFISTVDPCLITTRSCIETDCFTITSTAASCLPISSPPISSPTPTLNVDQCLTTTFSCNGELGCTAITSTATSCLQVSSPPISSPTPTSSIDPCLSTEVACDEEEEDSCSTITYTQASCLPVSSPPISSPTPTSSVGPCITSTVSCPVLSKRGKRQAETDCVTEYFTASSCLPSTSTPISSPPISSPIITPTISLPSCVTSTVLCTTAEVFGKRQEGVDCITSFYTISDCGITTSPRSIPINSSKSSSSSSTTPSPTLSINSCFTPEIICPTPTVAPLGLAIARLGAFLEDATRFAAVENDCVTTYVSISGCGITATPSSSSLPTPTNILSPPSLTPTVSVLKNSTLSVSSTSSFGSSTTSSPPILLITPSTSTSGSSLLSLTPLTSSSSVPTPSSQSPIIAIVANPSQTPIISPSTTSSLNPTLPPQSSATPLPLATPLSVSTISSPSVSIAPIIPPAINSPASLSTTSTAPLLPVPVSTSALSSSNSPQSTPLVITAPSNSNTILVPLITSSSIPLPLVSPQESLSLSSTQPASLSFGSTFRDISTPSPTVHLLTTPSPSNSAFTTSPRPTLESQQASTSGTIPPGSRITPFPSGTGGGDGNTNSSNDPSNAGLELFPINKVVVGNYVPVIVGRAFIGFLTPFYNTILLHEPIRQLTNPGGASFSTLAGSPAISIPITGVMLLAHLGSGFAAGVTFLDTSYCTQTPCPPRLSSNPWVMNLIISVLIIQAIAILIMLSHWWKKPNSLRADPTSIAGVAVVMGHPMIEQEFSDIPAELTVSELKKRLKKRRYKLGTFQTASGITKYGIMPVPPAEVAQRKERKPGFLTKLGEMKEKIPFINDWRNNRFYFDTVFAMLLIALLALTCAALVHANNSKIVFLATVAASGTGLRIFLAVLGTIVSWYWGRLFRDMQSFTPYIDLGRGDAEADPTILLRKHMFPITAFFPLLGKGHFTAASVAFTGLTAEFLIIALAGLPYRPGQQRGEFIFWSVLSLAILTLMVAQLLIVNVWRRRLPTLTRPPDTIAAVMTYVAETGMSRDFEGLSMAKTGERNKAIKQLGKSYAYGWRREPSGMARWVVDEVRGKERVPSVPPTMARRVDSFDAVRL